MPRRFNYTGRQKIITSDFSIELLQNGANLLFDMQLDLKDYKLDKPAHVYVEAYKSVSTLWKRFDFGRVGQVSPPADRSLNEFGKPEGIRFRIKVSTIGDEPGQLLAEADQITPKLPGQTEDLPRQPLISTEPAPLGDEPWRIDFSDIPVLQINDRLPDWKGLATHSLFQSLVLPAVLRQVLIRTLVLDRMGKDDDDPDEWRTRWITFAELLPGVRNCPGPLDNDGDNQADVEGWIDEAVEAFGTRCGHVTRLIKWQNGEPST